MGWVDRAPSSVLLRLHRLLDADDILLGAYRRALEADLSDCCPGVVHIAHTCAAALDYPDDLWLPSVRDTLASMCVDGIAAQCVRLGLLPYGAWAVGAACNCHEARPDPELHRLTLLAAEPAPWALMSDLIRVCHSYHASICAAAAVESDLNAALCLPALLRRVLTTAVQEAAHVWAPFDDGCRLLLSRLESGSVPAPNAAVEFGFLLHGVCTAFGKLAPSAGVPPSRRPAPPSGAANGSPVSSVSPLSSGSARSPLPGAPAAAPARRRAQVGALSKRPPPSGARRPAHPPAPNTSPATAAPRSVSSRAPSGAAKGARTTHNAAIPSIEELHRRTGVTHPLVIRTLLSSAVGVRRIPSKHIARFQTAASAMSSTKRTAVRDRAVDSAGSTPSPGHTVSVDLTHFFEKNSDGYTCAAVFLDMSTWLLWHFPMRDKTCGEFVQALAAYRRHVRETFSVDLRVVRTDNDPCFTDVHSRTHGNVRELQAYLDSLPANESIQFVHSPPEYQALNPVECAVR